MRRIKVYLALTCCLAGATSPASGADRPRKQRKPEPAEDIGAETASHKELDPLGIKFGQLTALRLHPNGSLLAADSRAKVIKVISPDGKLFNTIDPGFGPEAFNVDAQGTIYCGGQGQLVKASVDGEILKKASMPENVATPVNAVSRRRARGRPPRISGLAMSDTELFVAVGSGWSMGSKSKLFRLDLDFGSPTVIADGLRGCCQRCDIVFRDGVLYVAENTAHRVVKYDREGKLLGKWGQRSRAALAGFGSCCNPMNLCFDASGTLYTAESGMARIKRYSTDGAFLDLVGYVGVQRFQRAGHMAASCSNIAIAATPDGGRVYVMDFKGNLIRVLEKKG